MHTRTHSDDRRVTAHAQVQARKQAALDLFYKIMSADGETLKKACEMAGIANNGQSEDELRRQVLAWHRQRYAR